MLITIAFLVITAAAAGLLMEKFKLPALLGYLLTGLIFSPYMADAANLKDTFFDHLYLSKTDLQSSESAFIRTLALVIILLRAGLGLDRKGLLKNGRSAFMLSFIPCLMEAGAVTFLAHFLFEIPWIEASIIGFVLAAVSPAVIVPMMLKMQKDKIGSDKKIPTMVLAGSSVDDIVAISGFGICVSLLFENNTQSWQIMLGQVPLSIFSGAVLGFYAAKPLALIFENTKLPAWPKAVILIAVALAFKEIEAMNKIPFSSLIAVMTTGISLSYHSFSEAEKCGKVLFYIWKGAEVLLFVLIGSMVNFSIAFAAGAAGIIIILGGLAARSAGVVLSTAKSGLNSKEILFCVIAYIPKATVQAAIGSITLTLFLDGKIYLYAGLDTAELIISMAALSILITAPLGAIGIRMSSKKLLKQPED